MTAAALVIETFLGADSTRLIAKLHQASQLRLVYKSYCQSLLLLIQCHIALRRARQQSSPSDSTNNHSVSCSNRVLLGYAE